MVVLDTLTRKEWVKEDLLAEELKVAPKLLRKTLRYLEEEHILRREHRKEGKRAQNKDIVVLATKGCYEWCSRLHLIVSWIVRKPLKR